MRKYSGGTERNVAGMNVKRRGNYKISPVFSAGRSLFKCKVITEQPPKKLGATDMNTVPLFLWDCIVDVIAPPNAGRERVEMRERKCSGCLPFLGLAAAILTNGLWNGGRRLFLPTTDWNSRTEQRERPERARWMLLKNLSSYVFLNYSSTIISSLNPHKLVLFLLVLFRFDNNFGI